MRLRLHLEHPLQDLVARRIVLIFRLFIRQDTASPWGKAGLPTEIVVLSWTLTTESATMKLRFGQTNCNSGGEPVFRQVDPALPTWRSTPYGGTRPSLPKGRPSTSIRTALGKAAVAVRSAREGRTRGDFRDVGGLPTLFSPTFLVRLKLTMR